MMDDHTRSCRYLIPILKRHESKAKLTETTVGLRRVVGSCGFKPVTRVNFWPNFSTICLRPGLDNHILTTLTRLTTLFLFFYPSTFFPHTPPPPLPEGRVPIKRIRLSGHTDSEATYLERAYGVRLRRFPRENNAVRSDLPDYVQTDGVLRSDQAHVFPVVALKNGTKIIVIIIAILSRPPLTGFIGRIIFRTRTPSRRITA